MSIPDGCHSCHRLGATIRLFVRPANRRVSRGIGFLRASVFSASCPRPAFSVFFATRSEQ